MASREKVISDRAMRQWERLRLIDDTIEFVELKDITYLLRLSLTPDITAALTEGDPSSSSCGVSLHVKKEMRWN